MATQATNVIFTKGGMRARVDAFLSFMGQGFNAYIERRARVGEIEALNAKSDTELAAMGLKRDDIPQYVFRDLFYV